MTVTARPAVHPGQGTSLPGAGWAPPLLPHALGRGAGPTSGVHYNLPAILEVHPAWLLVLHFVPPPGFDPGTP